MELKPIFPRRLGAACAAALILAGGSLGNAEVDIRRDAIVEAISKTKPSVVNISTGKIVEVRDQFEDPFLEFFAPFHRRPVHQQLMPFSLGSGVIIDEEGFILTNTHVVQRADKIAVILGTNVYDAKLEAASATSDIALLKIQPKEKLQAVKFAKDDDLLLGETVIALGNPFGLGLSVSRGILSSTARRPQPEEHGSLDYEDWLQTDAAVNSGNSGGPLINLRGELIGINNAVLRKENAQGISFAIPIKRVGEAISEIFTPENKGFWFGAHIVSEERGLIVESIQPGSPAEKGGLMVGDKILRLGDKVPKGFIEFMVELIKRSEKQNVPLRIVRAGEQRDVTVRIVKEEAVFNADLVRQKLGMIVQALTPDIAEALGVQLDSGLVIAGVDKNTPAANADLRPGIILTGIDDAPVHDVKTLAKKLYEKRKGETVTLNLYVVQRQGAFLFPRAGRVPLKLR